MKKIIILIATTLMVTLIFSKLSKGWSNISCNCEPICPLCGTTEVNHIHLTDNKLEFYARCRACGYSWHQIGDQIEPIDDDGDDEEEED